MSTAIEAMGLCLPGSSLKLAESSTKTRECAKAAQAIKVCMENNTKPRVLITKESSENALMMAMALGGSTNGVSHLLVMARTAEAPLTLDDVQRVSNKILFLADLAPSGRFMMEDLFNLGGAPSVLKLLIAAGLMNGNILAVTGKTLAETIESYPSLPQDQVLIRPLNNPMEESSHIQILQGSLSPGGSVAKITGKEGLVYTGKARVFNKEYQLNIALDRGKIHAGRILF